MTQPAHSLGNPLFHVLSLDTTKIKVPLFVLKYFAPLVGAQYFDCAVNLRWYPPFIFTEKLHRKNTP